MTAKQAYIRARSIELDEIWKDSPQDHDPRRFAAWEWRRAARHKGPDWMRCVVDRTAPVWWNRLSLHERLMLTRVPRWLRELGELEIR